MYDTRPVCSPADPLEDPGWWARLYADLEADGMPEEEIPAGRMESYLAAFPEEAPLWTLPKGFTTAAGEDLARSPGAELTVAVEELLAVEDLSAEELTALVAAAHRSANWWATVRAQATARLAEVWTIHVEGDRPSRGEGDQARRLRSVEREALRRWRRGSSGPPVDATETATGDATCDVTSDGEAAALARAFTIAEVSLACGVSRSKVAGWLTTGQALAAPDRLTATARAAAQGLLDEAKVTAIVRATAPVSDRVAEAVDAVIVPRAALTATNADADADADPTPVGVEICTVPRLKDELSALLSSLDPAGTRARAAAARATRRVTWRRVDETMGELRALLPIVDGAKVLARLDEEAGRAGTDADDRTFYQRRADVLRDLVLDDRPCLPVDPDTGEILADGAEPAGGEAPRADEPGDGPRRPRGRRPRAQIVLTVPWETAAGIGTAPGTLAGFGPLPVDQVRGVVAEALRHPEDVVWRCAVVSGDHSTLLGLGSKAVTVRYRPSAGVRRFTEALYGQCCAFPGCDAPAASCDFDHVRPWPDGTTCTCNGIPLCRPCHRLKTSGLIAVRTVDEPGEPPGTLDWTTATGRAYRHRPPAQTPPTAEQLATTLTTGAPPY